MRQGKLRLPTQDVEADMYQDAIDLMEATDGINMKLVILPKQGINVGTIYFIGKMINILASGQAHLAISVVTGIIIMGQSNSIWHRCMPTIYRFWPII